MCTAAALLLACGPATDPGPTRIHTRLVAPEYRSSTSPGFVETVARARFPVRAGTATALPVATIANDTRPVLAAHSRAVIAYLHPIATNGRGLWRAELALPRQFAAKDHVLVELAVKPEAGVWGRPPVQACSAEAREERVVCVLTGRLPRGARRATLTAWALRPVDAFTHESLPIDVPAHASLELAFGVDAATPDAGTVSFRVEACVEKTCETLLTRDATVEGASPSWEPRRIPLEVLGGSRRSFRFSATSGAPGRAAAVFADPTITVQASDAENRPNLVLLSIDTLRADHLELYGHPRETAPFLTSRARERGTTFLDVTAEAATTDPSHMTIFTGLGALAHGVQRGTSPLAVPARTLAEILRQAGYATAAFTENGPLAHERGFRIGFDRYLENKSASLLSPDGQVDRTFAQLRDWIESGNASPFFAFLHTFQVHEPYAPPEAYARLFADDEHASGLHRFANAYDSEIRLVDDELRRLVEWMDARGLAENTIWIVLSDHGEEFREHGSVGHGTLPYQTVLHVPLVMWGPGVPAGRTLDVAAHHTDLLPTVLDLLGLPTPAGLPGRSLVGAPQGDPTGELEPRALLSASWSLPDAFVPPAFAVRRGSQKLLRYRTKDGRTVRKSFDLSRDPGERGSGSALAAPEALELEQLMDSLVAAAERRGETMGRARQTDQPAPTLDPEREEKLRALGYID